MDFNSGFWVFFGILVLNLNQTQPIYNLVPLRVFKNRNRSKTNIIQTDPIQMKPLSCYVLNNYVEKQTLVLNLCGCARQKTSYYYYHFISWLHLVIKRLTKMREKGSPLLSQINKTKIITEIEKQRKGRNCNRNKRLVVEKDLDFEFKNWILDLSYNFCGVFIRREVDLVTCLDLVEEDSLV